MAQRAPGVAKKRCVDAAVGSESGAMLRGAQKSSTRSAAGLFLAWAVTAQSAVSAGRFDAWFQTLAATVLRLETIARGIRYSLSLLPFKKCSKNAYSCAFDSSVGVWSFRFVIATRLVWPRSLLTAPA